MPRSLSHSPASHKRGAHDGGDGGSHDDGGGGGGGGDGGGKLVKAGFARSEPEAEMLQGLLLEEGIPSVLKRARGFDNPDFLASGPRDIFVAQGSAERARELLADTALETEDEERAEIEGAAMLARPGSEISLERRAFWLLVAMFAAALLVWVLYQLS